MFVVGLERKRKLHALHLNAKKDGNGEKKELERTRNDTVLEHVQESDWRKLMTAVLTALLKNSETNVRNAKA